jgi:pyruvate carboxylase
LSENAQFAKKVEQAGIAFIGPSPEVIDQLGDKTKARSIGITFLTMVLTRANIIIAMKVGVPVVPGTPGPVESYSEGDTFIKEYGFPGRSPHNL